MTVPSKRLPGLLSVALFALAAGAAADDVSAARRAASKKTTSKTVEIASPESAHRSSGEPISLDLKDADLKDVLKTLAELARINIAIDPEVKGSVTIRLHDVPWDQALDVILKTNGLGYVIDGRVLRVGLPSRLAENP